MLVAQSLDTVDEPTGALGVLLAAGLPTVLLLVAGVTWRAVGRALAPVEAIRAEVDAISAAELHRRVPRPAVNDEVGRLAGTMNRMLDRLERSGPGSASSSPTPRTSCGRRSPRSASMRRSPGSTRSSPAGWSRRRTPRACGCRRWWTICCCSRRRTSDSGPLRRRPVDLDDLVLEEARRLRDLRGPAVDTRGVGAARVDGDPPALRRVLRNLGDNAVRHARGRVALAVADRNGWAELHVDDDGPGVPAADRTRVFDRFVRLDDARGRAAGGSGLGLAIVAEVVAGTAAPSSSGTGRWAAPG